MSKLDIIDRVVEKSKNLNKKAKNVKQDSESEASPTSEACNKGDNGTLSTTVKTEPDVSSKLNSKVTNKVKKGTKHAAVVASGVSDDKVLTTSHVQIGEMGTVSVGSNDKVRVTGRRSKRRSAVAKADDAMVGNKVSVTSKKGTADKSADVVSVTSDKSITVLDIEKPAKKPIHSRKRALS